MTHELAVWLFNEYVGTLALVNGRLNFRYQTDWLNRPNVIALSHSLPLQVDAFDDAQTRPFFAGLLPEGRLRQLIAQQFQVSRQNDFALLNAIGGECAGAVTFLPPGKRPAATEDNKIQWLNSKQLSDVLDELPQHPMLAGKKDLRLSMAGVQDKLPVVFDGQRIGLPKSGQPSTHILKPPIHAIEDSVINEGFCLTLANTLKLPTAAARIHHVGKHHFLLVTRYDRQVNAAHQITRLHQEDFCQALGIVPEIKYQNEGGPDLTACFDLLRQATRPNAPQILKLLDYVIFSALIGNHDAHAKNFSLLYIDKSPVLAPLYDVLSTAIYPTLTPKMAMKVGSKYKFSEVQPRDWEQFAESAGLSRPQTRKRVRELASAMPIAARQLQSTPEFKTHEVIEKIATLIEQRAALTIQRLTLQGAK